MTQLYRCFDVDEETPVQFVGVHPLRWRPEWGEPAAMFREAHEKETLKAALELPEVQALVEAAKTVINKLEQVYEPGQGFSIFDNTDCREILERGIAPFDVEK